MIRAALNIACLALTCAAIISLLDLITAGDVALYRFLLLFVWRYLRLVINIIGFVCYRPSPNHTSNSGYYHPSRDVTVILPTVDPSGIDFNECLHTCAQNSPAKIKIVTAGDVHYTKTLEIVTPVQQQFPSVEFVVQTVAKANNRIQVAHAISSVRTSITVLLDDHVFWSASLLTSILSPFNQPDGAKIGLVGTNKRVRRLDGLTLWPRIWNTLGAIYLGRHNFETRATNAIDGRVFVVSARTFAIRTCILQHPDFLPGYVNETFLFGLLGPLNPDDDNFVTRFVVKHGWRIKIQHSRDAEIETTVGVDSPVAKKFLGQCRRWARTTWRSNSCNLFTDGSVWQEQPYCVCAVYLASLRILRRWLIQPWCICLCRRVGILGIRFGVWLDEFLGTKVVKLWPCY
ncbi:hypothetical protein B0H66DRAFT_589317 [Apodospora peruviana]|uniref:Glycosyltransferase family 2 protein n=1 Tax=Apodospora peruviana TaxID=516989 RepID=A0AAE0MCK7_9PEZI|nr:hypothetical protein B0H66DRAFT_589317 [Apodospora peruviana]